MDNASGWVAQEMACQPFWSGHHGIPCDLCAKSGQSASASGFCQNCNEFLCSTCIIEHNRFTALKDHNVLVGTDMPGQRQAIVDVEKCSKHPYRPLEMYCIDEGILGCTLCFFIEHKSCQNVDMISNLSKDTKSSVELAEIQRASAKQKELCNKKLKESILKFRSINDRCHTKCMEDFQGFRSEIEAILDRLGVEVMVQADKLQKENTEKLDSVANHIISYEQQIETCMEDIDRRLTYDQTYNDQLFIAVKKYKKQVLDDVLRLEQLDEEIHIQAFDFTYEPSIKVSLKRDCKVRVKDEAAAVSKCTNDPQENNNIYEETKTLSPRTKCSQVSRINIKTSEDDENCWVRGMVVVSETLLILTDGNNQCLKVVDVSSDTVIRRLLLASKPLDIACLPGSRVAVTIPNLQQIQIFSADQHLTRCGQIHVAYNCRGVTCAGNKIIVSCRNPAMVQILDMDGRVIQSVQYDKSGEVLFRRPLYLTVSEDSMLIYVSDYSNDTLTCLDKEGVVRGVYKDEMLNGPAGVVTGDNGCLYLCSWKSNIILVVSPEGVRLDVISLNEFEVQCPRSLCYSRHNGTLFLSSESCDHVNRNFITRLHLQ